tara:strand:+ start:552 stop:1385 length:834 start_codon:yes stop_codon:yes gene_type:complete
MKNFSGRSKKNIKNRVLNTNDSFLNQLFRSPIILLGFLLSKIYSFLKLDNFYIFRRVFFFLYYYSKRFTDRKNCKYIIKNIKKNDVFLDIGSAYGFYPFFLEKLKLNITIIAVEPDFICLKYLNDLKLFKNKKNKIINVGVFSKKTKKKLYISNQNRGENSLYKNDVHDYHLPIELDTIDNLLKKIKTDFIKIDTQGSEIPILQGMKRTLKKKVKLLVEYSPSDLMMQNNNFNLIKLLKKNKFKIKRLDYEKIVNSKQDLVDINYENLKQTDLFCFK